LLSEGGLVGNLSYILLIVSMAMRDIFWLRLFAICAGLMGAAYAYLWLNHPVGVFWELCFTLVNVVQWSVLLYERRLRKLSPEDARIKAQVSGFLNGLFSDGLFAGSTPDQAFFVIVDDTNNTPETIEAGQVIIDVGIAPNKPAEFVRFRFQQKTLTA